MRSLINSFLLAFVAAVLLSSCVEENFADLSATVEFDADEQAIIDDELIDAYIEEQGLENVMVSSTGLRYMELVEGGGPIPNAGDIVSVHYFAEFLDGEIFDTSLESVARDEGTFSEINQYIPLVLNVGGSQVIPAWDEALAMMNLGDRWMIIVPSRIGYRNLGSPSGVVPPNEVLVFTMDLVKIRD